MDGDHSFSPAMTSKGVPDDYQQYFFSPSFQCYTSPLFYRSLLLELEWVSSVVDDCKPPAREIVWGQLFVLSGMPKGLKSSKAFLPVVNNWMRGSTMNLLAIELLYLAFATALNQYPDFIKNNLTPKHRELASTLENTPYVPMTKQVKRPPPLPSSEQLLTSPIVQSISRFGDERSSHSNTDSPRFLRSHPPSADIQNVGQQPLPNFNSCFGTPSNHSATKTVESDLDIFKKLIQLQSWKGALDSQPSELKSHIWAVFRKCDEVQRIDTNSFSNTINMWAQDIVPNMNSISNLHGIVSQVFASQPPQSVEVPQSPLPSFLSPRSQSNIAAPGPSKPFMFPSSALASGHAPLNFPPAGDPQKRPLEHTFVDESPHSKKRMKTNFMDS